MTDSTAQQSAEPGSDRVRVRRRSQRASYEIEAVRAIFDEALLCRVAFIDGGHPLVLPTLHVRRDDTVYIHGAQTNRMLAITGSGAPVTVEATIVDSLVMGRSVFQNSMNYRSAVVLGNGYEVTDEADKFELMNALVDRIAPGRLAALRPLTPAELRTTKVVAVPITEFSAKSRTGPPVDKESDFGRPVWAGEIPLRITPGTPMPDAYVPAGLAPAEHLLDWGKERRGV